MAPGGLSVSQCRGEVRASPRRSLPARGERMPFTSLHCPALQTLTAVQMTGHRLGDSVPATRGGTVLFLHEIDR